MKGALVTRATQGAGSDRLGIKMAGSRSYPGEHMANAGSHRPLSATWMDRADIRMLPGALRLHLPSTGQRPRVPDRPGLPDGRAGA